jgi:hypothetical protein
MIDFESLAEAFAPEEIEWRVGSTRADKKKGMALAYLDARAVMDRLDKVCGPAGWQCRYPHANNKTVCDIAIKCGEEWVWKADGAGDTQFEAEKGALSDAFKRAAVRWGIGRYLYDLGAPWVALDAKGKIMQGEYKKLRDVLMSPKREPDTRDPQRGIAAEAMIAAMDMAETLDSLADWWEKNARQIEALTPEYRQLVKNHKNELKERFDAMRAFDREASMIGAG